MTSNDFNNFPKNGRLLGIDWGDKRIGVAVSTPDRRFVFARPVADAQRDIYWARIVAEERVAGIVVGLPLHLDGSESETSARVRNFAATLDAGVPVLLFDESLTSFAAEGCANLDSEAARIMLENAIAAMERGRLS
ncbi:MAG: Holliday junction resolvase RuvX [Rickettsiales bacterium]|jgi:putative Holliday junction resolvase|nr:Holliday junction resolvase RuvX [Rickettsiales bacterium]